MANISLKKLLTEAEDFKARSKETGKLVHFKSKDSYDAAIKAGSHEDPDTKKDSSKEEPVKGASMFGADYAKNRGGEVPKDKETPSEPQKVTSAPKVTEKIKKKIEKWTEKEKAFFERNEGAPGSKMRRSLGQALKDKAAGAWKAIKKGFKHEVEEFKAAGQGIQNFFSGIPLSEHEQKAVKAVAFKVVTTAIFGAAFGGLSHGAVYFAKHVALEFIPHVVGETILKGVTKAAVFADTEGEAEMDANMIKFTELIAKGLEEMEITPEMMEQMVDSYNEKRANENTMKNISLKGLIEAEDFKAKSKETGKLVHFKSKDAYQAALKAGTHEDPNAEKGAVSKASTKPNDMFGGDYANDRGGEAPNQPSAKLTPDSKIVKLLSKKTGVNGRALLSWSEQNSVDLEKIASDVESKKLNPMDFMTAVVGNSGNKYAKDIIAKYSQSGASAKADAPKAQFPKKASQLDDTHAENVITILNKEAGLDGYAQLDDNSGAIMYNASKGEMPTYTLYMGSNIDYGKPDEFRVSLEPTYGNDPSKLQGKIDKSFKSAEDANTFMIAVTKKYKKELQMDDDTNESTKLTKMIKK